jgi:outer membrane protein OmpA-like peptidoglycan-associated protein
MSAIHNPELRTMSYKISFVLGLLPLVAACAASLPPAELIDARAAYNKAAAGPAAQLNPAQLHVAQEQLALADRSFDKDGDTFRTRDEAYVAERKAELADVQARTTEANQQINLAAKEVQLTQARDLQSARTQLVQTREQLAAATAAMAELAALKTVQNVKHEDRGTVITLSGSVLFASAKYELLSSAQETLSNVANALAKSDPTSKIIVQGYTDSQGALGYNETLSQNRAQTVLGFLTSHGIAADRISARGFGPANPVATNDTAEGRANNRRVEIVISPPTEPVAAQPSSTSTQTTTTAVVR